MTRLPPVPGARGGGGGRGAPPPVTVVARTQDGREIRGVRRNEDQFSVQMVDAAGRLHLLDKLTLASVTIENRSLMPNDYATSGCHPTEITNLVGVPADAAGPRSDARRSRSRLPGASRYERLLKAKAEPHNWLMYWGDYQGTHYSPSESDHAE